MGVWNKVKNLFYTLAKNKSDVDLDEVQRLIGYHFRDDNLLLLSLTHRSFLRFNNERSPSNERLEFLGDSVLGLIIASRLFRDHPEESEGNLTKLKAMLVNEITLSSISKEIGLNNFILMSPEEDKSGGRDRPSIVSDAFESVIGAVFLDGGFEAARDVVLRLIYTRKENITSDDTQRNYKGELLELVQARGNGMPRYDVISEKGPDHEKEFHVMVSVSGKKVGEGVGSSKKEAEQKAASMALEYLEQFPENHF
ncbi:MAG: ribonuclease III [candidate division Zixibacteria bacterium]|nr:ribonuclease III [candidate division Zixibacteria bacterium]